MIIDVLLRAVAHLLPPLARARYLEEWRADAAGAAEAGLARRDVVLGAAALAVTIDRDAPAHTGAPRGTLPRRLSRRGFALLAGAAVILAGAYLTGGGVVPEGEAASAHVIGAFQVAGWLAIRFALLLAGLGVLYLARAAAAARTSTARATLVAAILGPVAVVVGALVPGMPAWLLAVGGGIVLLALVGGIIVLGGTRPLAHEHRSAPRRSRVRVAAAGTVLVVALVVIGTIDLVVWNPAAKVPGMDLATIYSLMQSRDGFNVAATAVSVGGWAAFWVVCAVVVLVLAARGARSAFTPRRIVMVMLGLVGGAVFFRFFAGFGLGMSIADTFATGGGDGSIVSAALPYIGQLALAGSAIAVGWAPYTKSAVSATA